VAEETCGLQKPRVTRVLAFLPLLAVLAACPPPVSNTLAIVVADKIPPTLIITTPQIGQSYTSVVNFTGTVSDDAATAGDGKGILGHIAYSVANNVLLRGKILINQDGTTRQVSSYGPGIITWIPATRTFSFSFSTVSPSPLHGLLTVIVDTTDANGNVTTQVMQLAEGTGPVITLESPTKDTGLKYIGGTTSITLTGTVANAPDDLSSATNISSLAWGVTGKTWGAALDLAAGQTSVANTGFSVNQDFTYTAATRTFTTGFVVPFINDTQLILTVSATDHNGHTTTHTTVLVADVSGPQLTLTSPITGLFYSSTHFAPLTVSGNILLSEVPTVKAVTYLVSGSGFTSNSVSVYTNNGSPAPPNFFDASGNFSFSLSDPSASLTGRHGTVQVTITIPNQANISTVVPFSITEDSTPPSVTSVTLTSSNANNAYAKIGDTVTLTFQTADAGSGMAGDPTAIIEGASATVTPLGGGSFSAQHVMQPTDPSDANVAFTINATDVIGNVASVSTPSSNVKFYANAPALSSVTMASSNAHPAWAKIADTVTLSFVSPRDLQAAAAVSLASHVVSPSPPSLSAHSYTAAWTMTGSDAEGTIPFTINIIDAAGNVGAQVSAVTSGSPVVFDRTPPPACTVKIDQTIINSLNMTEMSFTFTGAEPGAAYSYGVTSGGGGGTVTGSGTIGAADQQVTEIDVSGLNDGLLTLSVTLTDAAGNPGAAAMASKSKDATPPAGYTVSIDQPEVDQTNETEVSFTFTGAEPTATYSYRITSNGGGSAVTGSGTIEAADQQVKEIDVSGLNDGLLKLSVTLTDTAGNKGSPAEDTVTKDTAP
jgi:hypothetical protein